MEKHLREEILAAMEAYASGSTEPFIEQVMNKTWGMDITKKIISSCDARRLQDTDYGLFLALSLCLYGADELFKIEGWARHSINLAPVNYLETGLPYLKRATQEGDINIFFKWYESEILKPLGFTDSEIQRLYALAEGCCARLCMEIHGVKMQTYFISITYQ